MEINQINLYGQIYDIKDAFARALVADEYSTSSSYSEGDLCIYDDNLYKCLSSTTGSWDSSAWSSTTIVDNLGSGGGEGYNFDITQDEWNTIVAINNQTISGTLSLSGATEIGSCMFWGCSSLEEVNFLDCIKIGYSAFGSCTSLQSVNFPVCTTIGYSAFGYCTSLQSISFPSCIFIDQSAFQYCTSLQSINFPACTTIGRYAFQNCTSLQSISFPACTTILNYAFQSCTSLQSANFPVCTFISNYAFDRCHSLSAIYLLGSSVCTLTDSTAFTNTPILNSTYLGYFGSIYVPSSLVASYQKATNWTYYSNRIVGV